MLVSDFVVERLIRLGVRHAFGVGGANIEDMFSAVQRRRPEIRAVLGKHEHGAGTAADAYARLRGLGVVLTTSGGGAMNLVHALAEARASRVPLLAIVGEPPADLQGRGAFQDTSGKAGAVDAELVFRAAAGRCFRLESVEALPDLLDRAIDAVRGVPSGPAVLLISKDKQRAELHPGPAESARTVAPRPRPPEELLARAAQWLTSDAVLIIAGAEVARGAAQDALAALARRVDAAVATTPDGRDAFDNDDPRFCGVAGAMGHEAVARAAERSRTIVAVGTRLPVLAREAVEERLSDKRLLAIGWEPPFVGAGESLWLAGELSQTLELLAAAVPCRSAPPKTQNPAPEAGRHSPTPAGRLTMTTALAVLDRAIPDGSVVLVDAGNTGASAIHQLRAARGGRWLVAMGMAGMGYAFGAAVGAAFASGARCFVVAGDGALFMHGMEIHTAVQHALPITYVIMNNRAHGMCLVRERLLLGENGGYNEFRSAHLGAGLRRTFPGLGGGDCRTAAELEALLDESVRTDGPSIVGVELEAVEVPPFAAFLSRAPSGAAIGREVADD
jgi:acetolactate synthase I/II/III large subunit